MMMMVIGYCTVCFLCETLCLNYKCKSYFITNFDYQVDPIRSHSSVSMSIQYTKVMTTIPFLICCGLYQLIQNSFSHTHKTNFNLNDEKILLNNRKSHGMIIIVRACTFCLSRPLMKLGSIRFILLSLLYHIMHV